MEHENARPADQLCHPCLFTITDLTVEHIIFDKRRGTGCTTRSRR